MLAGLFLVTVSLCASEQPAASEGTERSESNSSRSAIVCEPSTLGSPYIPVDSWVYPAVLRLYSVGYVDHVYLGMRPWTRPTRTNSTAKSQRNSGSENRLIGRRKERGSNHSSQGWKRARATNIC